MSVIFHCLRAAWNHPWLLMAGVVSSILGVFLFLAGAVAALHDPDRDPTYGGRSSWGP